MSLLDQKPGRKKKDEPATAATVTEEPKLLEVMGGAPQEEQVEEKKPDTSAAQENHQLIEHKATYTPSTERTFSPGAMISQAGDISLQANEIKLSLVKIVQPTSQDGHPGNFYNIDTGEEWPELEGYVLDIQRGFVNFGPRDSQEAYQCASRDCLKCQNINGDTQPAEACEYNPAKWLWKDKKPSPCHFTYSFIFNTKNDDVFLLSIHQPTSYDAVKTFLTAISTKATGRNVIKSGLIPGKFYLYPVTIGLKEEKNDKGRYYTVTFKLGNELITPDDQTFFAKRAEVLSGLSAMEKFLTQAEKDKANDGGTPDISSEPSPF